jgi:hypothetical protein
MGHRNILLIRTKIKLSNNFQSSITLRNFTEIHPIILEINPCEQADEWKENASNKYDERERNGHDRLSVAWNRHSLHCGKSLIASAIIIGGETDTWTRCCNKPLITNAESSQVHHPHIHPPATTLV